MFRHKTFIFLIACAWLAPALAQQAHDPETWAREHALRASVTPQSRAHANTLMQGVRAGDDRATLANIQSLDRDPELPAPARERLLYEFVNELRQEAPRAVGPEVMAYLANYRSTVLVPSEDHPRMVVPLFNIRTATAGLDNQWTRQESTLRGSALLHDGAHELVEAYAASGRVAEQRGLLDALGPATPPQRQAVAEAALQDLEAQPQLLELAGAAALLNDDSAFLARLLERAHGEGLHRLLAASAQQFGMAENARLFDTALDSGSVETAALAIATLAPVLAMHGPSVDRLFTELGRAETGSAAALALAGNPDPDVLTRLEAIARDQGGTLAASRAQLALQLIEARLVRDVQ